MKKFLAGMIVVLMIFGMTVSVSASDTENESSDGSVEIISENISSTRNKTMSVSFNISESYKIKIPASLPLKKNASGKFEGTAEIWANPQLSSNKSLKVVMSSFGWIDTKYTYADSQQQGNGAQLTEVKYDVNNTAETGNKTMSFTVTPQSGSFLKFNGNQGTGMSEGITIMSACESATSEVNFVAETENLSAGTYNYSQTFYVWAE